MLAKRRIANFRQNCEFAILNQDYGVVVYKPTPLGIFWLFCICLSQNILAIETPNMPVMLCWMLFHWNNAILPLLQMFFSFHTIFNIGIFCDATFFNSIQQCHKILFVKNFIRHVLQTKNLTNKLLLCLVIFTLLRYYIHLLFHITN